MSIVTRLENLNSEIYELSQEDIFKLLPEVQSYSVMKFLLTSKYCNLFPIFLKEYRDKNSSYNKVRLLSLFNRYLNFRHDMFISKISTEKENDKLGMWKYISYFFPDFIYKMNSLMKLTQTHTFFDVGCGAGDKFILAKHFLDTKLNFIGGIEYQTEYVEKFKDIRRMYDLDDINIINKNAFKLTPEEIKDYDFFYFYMPMKDEDKLKELYKHIFNIAKDGSFFIDVYYRFSSFMMPYGGGELFKKSKGKLIRVV